MLRYFIGILVVAATLSGAFTFTVQEGHAAVVIRFGNPVRTLRSSGLYPKSPWPIEQVADVDMRYRSLVTPQTELLTRDKKNIVLTTGAMWKPSDPTLYYRTLGDTRDADERLVGLITNAKIAVFGGFDLSSLVSTEEDRLQVGAIEAAILNDVNQVSIPRYGIEVVSIGFQRVSLPEENTRYVLDQMRAERRRHAAEFRAEGALAASRIRSAADLESAQVRAAAEEEAARIRGEAEAEAARIYADAHRADPDFYRFVRSLDSLERLLGENTNVTLRTDADPFRMIHGTTQTSRRGRGDDR
ncbi:MAG: protease modulator HflC [Myxococcota bacterium]